MSLRHKSRELAVQLSYQWAVSPESLTDEKAIERFWTEQSLSTEEAKPYFLTLVKGVRDHMPELDKKIESALENWRMDRVEKVDLATLRVAVYELFYENDVPDAVVIDEAIEVAKKFCAKDSPSFVNGVLDALRKTK